MIADSACDIALCRALTHQVAWEADAGMPRKLLHAKASMVKLTASEAAGRVIDRAVQIFGGRGYMREQPVERLYRDIRVDRIWEGTSEIQRMVIANDVHKRGLHQLLDFGGPADPVAVAAREIRPASLAVDAADTEVPWGLWRAAARLGLTAFMLPEAYGGAGMTDTLTACIVQEELSHGCAGIGNLITSGGFYAEPVLALGDEAQRERWLRPLTGEDPPLTALAITEPESGSDGPPIRKMGQRAIPNCELFLDDVFVAEDRRLGEEGQGFSGLMATFDRSRVTLAASATGLARAALEFAVDYAKQRTQFGRPIAEHQAVAFRLADMALRVDASRLLTWRAAERLDRGERATTEAAMAKLHASETAMWCTWAAVQTLGGWGYSREYPVEKWMRDAKLEEIEEGTSDIQRLVISRGLLR